MTSRGPRANLQGILPSCSVQRIVVVVHAIRAVAVSAVAKFATAADYGLRHAVHPFRHRHHSTELGDGRLPGLLVEVVRLRQENPASACNRKYGVFHPKPRYVR